MINRAERSLDWMLFSLYLGLVAIGWIMLYSVGYGDGYGDLSWSQFFGTTEVGKQTIFIGASLVLLFFLNLLDAKFWQTFAYPIFVLSVVLLIGVLFFGREIKGATSWYALPGFGLQPSEFAKFATCLAVASYLAKFSTDLRFFRFQIQSVGILLIPVVLILLQPDAGSALVFLSLFMVFYREGFPANFYLLAAFVLALVISTIIFSSSAVALGLVLTFLMVTLWNAKPPLWVWGVFVVIAVVSAGITYYFDRFGIAFLSCCVLFLGGLFYLYRVNKTRLVSLLGVGLFLGMNLIYVTSFAFESVLKPHQQDRINVWLNPSKCDPQGSLYNLVQSKMAIGSGGLQGKGFLEGNLTKGNYIPEQSTDFIFCVIGEEQGFIGTVGIIGLFLLLLFRIIQIAERQRSSFSRIYAYSVASILFVHVLVNIGMTMGLMPVIGIPLPFISKGGSSLLGFTLMIGVLLKLDKHRFSM